jgi:adenylyltransferase/sulfurtransferase
MPIVIVPEAYRGPTRGLAQIEVEATTVGEALLAVEADHKGFRELVFTAAGDVHKFVKLFVNDEQIDSAKLDLELGEADRLEVLAAIAGG